MPAPANDHETALEARAVAVRLRAWLAEEGFSTPYDVYPSGNLVGGFTVEATRKDGFSLNIEVVGAPWDEDGTYDENTL